MKSQFWIYQVSITVLSSMYSSNSKTQDQKPPQTSVRSNVLLQMTGFLECFVTVSTTIRSSAVISLWLNNIRWIFLYLNLYIWFTKIWFPSKLSSISMVHLLLVSSFSCIYNSNAPKPKIIYLLNIFWNLSRIAIKSLLCLQYILHWCTCQSCGNRLCNCLAQAG